MSGLGGSKWLDMGMAGDENAVCAYERCKQNADVGPCGFNARCDAVREEVARFNVNAVTILDVGA
jgi:hypothetical protein